MSPSPDTAKICEKLLFFDMVFGFVVPLGPKNPV
jgi:hypothetical protein